MAGKDGQGWQVKRINGRGHLGRRRIRRNRKRKGGEDSRGQPLSYTARHRVRRKEINTSIEKGKSPGII